MHRLRIPFSYINGVNRATNQRTVEQPTCSIDWLRFEATGDEQIISWLCQKADDFTALIQKRITTRPRNYLPTLKN